MSSHKIAVTGLGGAGKTVFLTSLIEHLSRHSPDSDDFPCRGHITQFEKIATADDDLFTGFPQEKFRAQLRGDNSDHTSIWPEKTLGCLRYRCRFSYHGAPRWFNRMLVIDALKKIAPGKTRDFDLEFIDLPGERFADLSITQDADFFSWSKDVLAEWSQTRSSEAALCDYFRTIENHRADEQVWLREFKRFLTTIIVDHRSLITPSSFFTDLENHSVFSERDRDNFGIDRICGRRGKNGGAREFSPLPPNFIDTVRAENPENLEGKEWQKKIFAAAEKIRTNHKFDDGAMKKFSATEKIIARFAANFADYRDAIVKPMFRALDQCDTLLVLIDIPGLLAGGVQKFNDALYVSKTLEALLGRPPEWYQPWCWRSLRRVALVATKCDLVHNDDRDCLIPLLNAFGNEFKRKNPILDYAFFTVSAIKSADSVMEHKLEGITAVNNPQRERRRIDAITPPSEWDATWQAGKYPFTPMQPPNTENRIRLPRQLGMEKLFMFMTGLSDKVGK